MGKSIRWIGLCWFLASQVQAAEPATLTYPDLVKRLYDMKRLASRPAPGQRSGNFSSYDRGARYNEATGHYEYWWANDDGSGFMDDQGAMMELSGPGVIWRIWSAAPDRGLVELNIDGQEPPQSEGLFQTIRGIPFLDLFEDPVWKELPELVHIKARGQNNFVPIPFQKSIVIKGHPGWGRYYQITYTQFPKNTKVPSFTGTFTDRERAALQKANDTWAKRGPRLFVGPDAKEHTRSLSLAPGQEREIASFTEPAAITSIVMDRPKMDRDASVAILRELTLAIYWDGQDKPSVWAPLGDFFGTGAGENLHRTLATGMTEAGYYSNWYMPFKSARIVVRNDGKEARSLHFAIDIETLKKAPNELLRFHCKWHRDDFSGFDKQQLLTERWPDWPVLKVDNTAGRFCGFHAHMWNPNHNWNAEHKEKFARPLPPFPLFKPGNKRYLDFYRNEVANHYWWGEGDEKFFVDGEKMPSTFGTGTEDYFGYAWGTSEAFDSALQAQPRNGAADRIGKNVDNRGPGNIGHICNARWQIADNVPFQQSFEAVIEKYHPNEWPLLNAYTAVWYQRPGVGDYYEAVPPEQRSGYFVPAKPRKP